MAEEIQIFEKNLVVKGDTQNYCRLDTTNGFPAFPEKHYLPRGMVPAGAKIVCRYFLIKD